MGQDLRNRDLRNPAWKVFRHIAALDDVGCLRQLIPDLSVTQAEIDALFDELASSVALRKALGSPAVERWNASALHPIEADDLAGHLGLDGGGRGRHLLLYVTTRLLQPEIVIETGCFTGRDSAVLLQALELNGRGQLYTIDLPAAQGRFSQHGQGEGLPEDLDPGFLVPAALHQHWTLILGDVRAELPSLLHELGEIGLLFHDSHHTYAHMMWEYTSVWPRLAENGLLVSDDISWNTSFWDFAAGVGRRPVISRRNAAVGALSAWPGVTL